MKAMKMLVLAVVSVLFVFNLSGCQDKNYKMREFLHRYGNVTIEDAYKKSGFNVAGNDFNSLKIEIDSLNIKDNKTKEVNGEIQHFVKAKITYNLKFYLKGSEQNWIIIRWMQLAIQEDGFGNMLVDLSKSKEALAIGESEKQMLENIPGNVKDGENLMK